MSRIVIVILTNRRHKPVDLTYMVTKDTKVVSFRLVSAFLSLLWLLRRIDEMSSPCAIIIYINIKLISIGTETSDLLSFISYWNNFDLNLYWKLLQWLHIEVCLQAYVVYQFKFAFDSHFRNISILFVILDALSALFFIYLRCKHTVATLLQMPLYIIRKHVFIIFN
jgi:hypothetical protein